MPLKTVGLKSTMHDVQQLSEGNKFLLSARPLAAQILEPASLSSRVPTKYFLDPMLLSFTDRSATVVPLLDG